MRKVLTQSSYEANLGAFDACLKAGVGNAMLVGKLLCPRSPEMDTFLQTLSPGAFCSLSAGSDSEKSNSLFSFPLGRLSFIGGYFAVTRSSTQRTEASPCAVRTRERTNGRTAIRKGVPASQQRVSPSGLTTFPPAGKSRLSRGKRYMGERLQGVIRRALKARNKAILVILGYGALTEQARMTGSTLLPNTLGYGSVAGITEQEVVQSMDLDYILSVRTNGANPFKVFERLSHINKEVLARRIKSLSYEQFLQTAYWFAVSSVAKSRAGMRCQVCNGSNGLNVHHRTYDTHGYEHENMNDLTVLDENCHGLFHGHIEPVPKKLIKERRPRVGRVVAFEPSDVSMPDGDPIILTAELIDRCRANGSFTNATLRSFGLFRPLIAGWVSGLIGESISREKFKEALEGRFKYGTGPLAKAPVVAFSIDITDDIRRFARNHATTP